jgi:hypothetical protein
MPDPLEAEFIDDMTSIEKPKAETPAQRRRALRWCLNNIWHGVDIDTLERVDDDKLEWHGWAMWKKT